MTICILLDNFSFVNKILIKIDVISLISFSMILALFKSSFLFSLDFFNNTLDDMNLLTTLINDKICSSF